MTILTNTLSTTIKKYLEKTLYISLFSCIAFTSATYADDTEVFTATTGADSSRPNVLLLFDSSASMNQNIRYYDGYDLSLVIDDSSSSCSNDYIYADTGTNNNLPSCSNANRIALADFHCADIGEFLVEIGYASARVKQRTCSNCDNFADFGSNKPIECLGDQGKHGEGQVLALASVEFDDGDPDTTNPTQTKVTYDLDASSGNTLTFIKTTTGVGWNETEDTGIAADPYTTWSESSFVTFYTGHFLNFTASTSAVPVSESGIDLSVKALRTIINEFSDINLGIARYNQGGGKDGHILAPIVSLETEDVRNDLIEYYLEPMTTNKSLTGLQPMAAGIYESYKYFKGEAPTTSASPSVPATSTSTAPTGNNIPSAIGSDGKYISPIKAGVGSCQSNYVLFLTAGGSSGESNTTEGNMNRYMTGYQLDGTTLATTETSLQTQLGTCGTGKDSCLDEGTEFMYNNDLSSIANGVLDGAPVIQNVTTYGVSINSSAADLDTAATVGGGSFQKAENPAAIEAALREIINEIRGNNSTFVAPSISVNNFNRLENLNDLYYSLFTPTEYGVWDGNLKKYKLIDGQIKDALDNLAVDPSTGAFNEEALSYWTNPADPRLDANEDSPNTDGDMAELGGFASRRQRTPRKTYTNIDDDTTLTALDRLRVLDTSITNSVLNLDSSEFSLTATQQDAIRPELIRWGRGLIPNDAGTAYVINDFVGDLLHTTPVVLTYFNNATSVDDLDQTIYFGTNNGFIHAAKADPTASEGIEEFAFAPHETLSNMYTYYLNESSTNKLYGIDGPMTSWIDETDNDLIIDSTEKAYVYATQRRGGRNIYALEVSDRTNPELAWKIRGGVDTGFGELGQTWSAVQHATIQNNADADNPLEVVFFAGGYDENQDAASSSSTAPASATDATMGRAIYMVNAKTGALLWRASFANSYDDSTEDELDLPNMKYSIPSDLRVLDVNADGFADRIYVGDLGGQIWRFDMTTPKISTHKFRITGGVIASLSKSNAGDTSALDTTTNSLNNKRFYNAPSVSFVSNNAYGTYLALSIGSGYRAHPLDTSLNEKFYMIKDSYVYGPELDTSFDPIYRDTNIIYDNSTDLIDISNIVSPTFAQVSGKRGWSIDFSDSGEKVINPGITADNKVFFTTYIPESTSNSTVNCNPNAQLGKSRLYGVSLLTGGIINQVTEYDDNGDPIAPTTDDRYSDLATPGISPPPELFIESITDGSTNASAVADCATTTAVTLLVGTETVNPNVCTEPVRTYWQRVEE